MAHKSIGKLGDEAATLLQRTVRLKAVVHTGSEYIQCVSCGKSEHWTKMQGGHYVPRQFAGTKLLEENIHPQCQRCNGYLGGNTDSYAVYMSDMYGADFLKELDRMKRSGHKWVRADLINLIASLKEREQQLRGEM